MDVPDIPKVKAHTGLIFKEEPVSTTNNVGSSGCFGHTIHLRKYATIDGKKADFRGSTCVKNGITEGGRRIEALNLEPLAPYYYVPDDAVNGNFIKLPFQKDEYPIYAEHHKYKNEPCMCCFRHDGRMWQLKGCGKKSKRKNKGMKRDRRRDLKVYHDFS